jgi:hypothetical protein
MITIGLAAAPFDPGHSARRPSRFAPLAYKVLDEKTIPPTRLSIECSELYRLSDLEGNPFASGCVFRTAVDQIAATIPETRRIKCLELKAARMSNT